MNFFLKLLTNGSVTSNSIDISGLSVFNLSRGVVKLQAFLTNCSISLIFMDCNRASHLSLFGELRIISRSSQYRHSLSRSVSNTFPSSTVKLGDTPASIGNVRSIWVQKLWIVPMCAIANLDMVVSISADVEPDDVLFSSVSFWSSRIFISFAAFSV